MVERDGTQANLWLRNEAKLWASICESRLHSVPAVLCPGGLVVRAVVKEPARAALVAQTPHDLSPPSIPHASRAWSPRANLVVPGFQGLSAQRLRILT